jgi:hypothetical protein
MAKLKRINGQITIYKALHRKLNIEQHVPHKKSGWTQVCSNIYSWRKLLLFPVIWALGLFDIYVLITITRSDTSAAVYY